VRVNGDIVIQVLQALHRFGVRYKVVGAVALNLQGLARATEVLDLFVADDDANVLRLRAALQSVFADDSIEEIQASDLRGDYPAIQYVPPVEGFHIDLMTRLGVAFDYASIEADTLDVGGVPVLVASPRMLHRMKRGTVRPQDRADAARLAAKFEVDD